MNNDKPDRRSPGSPYRQEQGIGAHPSMRPDGGLRLRQRRPIRADFAQSLINIARRLYVNEPFGVDLANSYFVIRGKSNLRFQRRYSRPSDRTIGTICDQLSVLTGFHSAQDYPTPLRCTRSCMS